MAGLVEELRVVGLNVWVGLGVVLEPLKEGFEGLGTGEVRGGLSDLLVRPAVVSDVGFGDVEELETCDRGDRKVLAIGADGGGGMPCLAIVKGLGGSAAK